MKTDVKRGGKGRRGGRRITPFVRPKFILENRKRAEKDRGGRRKERREEKNDIPPSVA